MNIEMIEKLLNIANDYVNYYCELHDVRVLSYDEIEEIDDEVEKEEAKDLKETDDFLNSVATYIEEYKNKKRENEEEEEI